MFVSVVVGGVFFVVVFLLYVNFKKIDVRK